MKRNKAIFLDKDGTIVEGIRYSPPAKKEEVLHDIIMTEKIIKGLHYLLSKGFLLIIISNQPWISRGIVSAAEIENSFRDLTSVGIDG